MLLTDRSSAGKHHKLPETSTVLACQITQGFQDKARVFVHHECLGYCHLLRPRPADLTRKQTVDQHFPQLTKIICCVSLLTAAVS